MRRSLGPDRIHLRLTAPAWRAAVPALERVVDRAARAALATARSAQGRDVSLVLAGDARVRALNRRWRRRDKATNVLAFPAGPMPAIPNAPHPLGDVIIALGVARAEARRGGMTLAAHLSHLVVHGILHLLGHDHETAAEATRMERLETRTLAALGFSDPYAGFEGDV